ncbi:hypothetical protein FVIR_GE00148 [Candidatus Gullanella endobia]|uniref:UPF0259 membrane protein FVIR_GE00148 n=1 Tax=Candidatus Gullanella endobia TaxID=1070130 RepID=A0A143WQI8_9ENTR|nr:YciC family protein [Candidatus Gullanella endobia]CUX95953.1 hypothetical protein FVIR_GE00148 [Candidatus Gullanella endobia]
MLIMVNSLYRDMLNFFRNQFTSILLLVFLTAFFNTLLSHTLFPENEQLIRLIDSTHIKDTTDVTLQQLVQKLSLEKKLVLLKASIIAIFSGLISNILLVGGLLSMIHQISNRKYIGLLHAIFLLVPLLPRLMLLIFITTLLVKLGLLLIIIPGIFLAIVFSLAPIIIISDNLDVIKSMCLSASIASNNFRLLIPAIFFWFLAKTALLLMSTQFSFLSSLVTAILLNSLNNLISSLLLIYLYRLYMLLQKN